jgi:hypothetical protein
MYIQFTYGALGITQCTVLLRLKVQETVTPGFIDVFKNRVNSKEFFSVISVSKISKNSEPLVVIIQYWWTMGGGDDLKCARRRSNICAAGKFNGGHWLMLMASVARCLAVGLMLSDGFRQYSPPAFHTQFRWILVEVDGQRGRKCDRCLDLGLFPKFFGWLTYLYQWFPVESGGLPKESNINRCRTMLIGRLSASRVLQQAEEAEQNKRTQTGGEHAESYRLSAPVFPFKAFPLRERHIRPTSISISAGQELSHRVK